MPVPQWYTQHALLIKVLEWLVFNRAIVLINDCACLPLQFNRTKFLIAFSVLTILICIAIFSSHVYHRGTSQLNLCLIEYVVCHVSIDVGRFNDFQSVPLWYRMLFMCICNSIDL